MQFFPCSGHIDTALRMYYMDTNEMYGEKLRAILNKSWRQHPTKQLLYGHLPPITKTIQVRWTRHGGHCWRSGDRFISNILLWTPSHGWAEAGWPARTYIRQFCANTGCSLEDLPRAMDDRGGWWERVKEICAGGATWWWWWWCGLLPYLHQAWYTVEVFGSIWKSQIFFKNS